MPAMLFRDGRPWVVVGSMGGDAQPQVHAQVVSALVDVPADVATAVARPRWFVEPAEHYAPPDTVRIEPRFGPGCSSRAGRAWAIGWLRPNRSTARSGTATRSSSSTADRPRAAASPRRLTPAARACRPPGRLPTGRQPAWPASASDTRAVTSNVGQNYPYSSETEADRAATIARLAGSPRRARAPSSRPRRRRSTRATAGGSTSARPRAAPGSSMSPASPTTCMPSTSSATGPAPRPSCADRPAARRGGPPGGLPRSIRPSCGPPGGSCSSTPPAWSPRASASASSSA